MMSSPSTFRNTWESDSFVQSHISIRKLFFLLFFCRLTLSSSGNWGVDLQAGSEYGYKLLFVVLLAGVFAVLLQVRHLHNNSIKISFGKCALESCE